jgi:choline dehydrogenase-like flavoprotein
VLRQAGAWVFYQHQIGTFSHAVGTVRMGGNPRTSALDRHGRFRGLANLLVLDGSFMPRSSGVNPSLTIAANALRCAAALVGDTPRPKRSHVLVAR